MADNVTITEIIDITSDMLSSDFIQALNDNFNYLDKKASFEELTNKDIADGAIGADDLATDSVTKDKILNGEVTENKLATDSVTKDKIQDGAVTKEKLNTSLQTLLNSTRRIFIVDEIPTGTQITDIIKGTTFTARHGDIILKI